MVTAARACRPASGAQPDHLISLRHARTLTRDALAAASALPHSTIANLESGKANPSLAVLVKVAGAFGVPVDELPAARHAKKSAYGSAARVSPRGRWSPSRCRDGMMYCDGFRAGRQARRHAASAGNRRILEYFNCLDGRVWIVVAGQCHDLEAGDVLAFPGNIPTTTRTPSAQRAGSRWSYSQRPAYKIRISSPSVGALASDSG